MDDSLNISFGTTLDSLNFFKISTYCNTLSEISFFNFTTFVTAMAVLILAWTNSNYRYKFRFQISFISPSILLGIVFLLGLATVANDYTHFNFIWSYSTWQLILSIILLLLIFYWAFSCFVRPPKFRWYNHSRFRVFFQDVVFRRNYQEMTSLVSDFRRSIQSIIRFSKNQYEIKEGNLSEIERDALMLIDLTGNDFFAKAVVDVDVRVAVDLFRNAKEKNKINHGMHVFAGNFITQALMNENSFLYTETKYTNGSFSYYKPVISTIYSDYDLVHAFPQLLFPHNSLTRQWRAQQIEVYCAILLASIKGFFEKWYDDYFFNQNFEELSSLTRKVLELNGVSGNLMNNESWLIYKEVINFYRDLILAISEISVPKRIQKKFSEDYKERDFFDIIADSIVKIMNWIGDVRGPNFWLIQYMNFWDDIFHTESEKESVKILMFKLRRAIYLTIKEDGGYMGIRIHMMILNVMGLSPIPRTKQLFKEDGILHRWLLYYTKYNLWTYYQNKPDFVNACMPDGMSIDVNTKELVRTIPSLIGLQKQERMQLK